MDVPPSSIKEHDKQCVRRGYTPLSSWAPRSGSDWRYEELLTFRVLHKRNEDSYPEFLKANIPEAKKILAESEDFRHAVSLFEKTEWQRLRHNVLRRQGKTFGNFFCLLAELMELQPQTVAPRKSERNKNKEPSASSSSRSTQKAAVPPMQDSQSLSSESSGLTSEVSEVSIDYSDPRTLSLQKKSEVVGKSVILGLLGCLSDCTSDDNEDRSASQFEWATTQDNFSFEVPNGKKVNTRNDGGFVRRHYDSADLWTRESARLCYCSIEAKSIYKASGARTTSNVYAQQASQIIGIIHQRKRLGGEQVLSQQARAIFPLISISHRLVNVIFATHNSGYDDFLIDGDSSKNPFLTMTEYGAFRLDTKIRFRQLSELIIAFMLFLKNNTDEDSRSENEEGDNEEDGEEDEIEEDDWQEDVQKEDDQEEKDESFESC